MNHAPTMDPVDCRLGIPCRNFDAVGSFNALPLETVTDFCVLRASLRSEQKDKHASTCIKALNPTFSKKTSVALGQSSYRDSNLGLNYRVLSKYSNVITLTY